MSHSYYGKQWVESQGGILDLLEIELPPEPTKPEKVFTAVSCITCTIYFIHVQQLREFFYTHWSRAMVDESIDRENNAKFNLM
ncbi:hypothetical protein ACROYT_G032663 [Oculina patagonica]